MRHTLAVACLSLLVVIGASTLLTACNTVSGLGRDVSKGGEAIERTAEKAK
ncbi:MAG: entericidin A/B family lipoprotein [Reyranellaceae bacterium]